MENKKERIEDFKTAIISTIKSLSNSQKIDVSFGSNSNSVTNSIKLPELQLVRDKINYEEIRAVADSKSLNYRFSDKKHSKNMSQRKHIQKIIFYFRKNKM